MLTDELTVKEAVVPITLETFVANLCADAEKFEAAYRAKAAENPDHYPLCLPNENSGLWLEFFIQFVETGKA